MNRKLHATCMVILLSFFSLAGKQQANSNLKPHSFSAYSDESGEIIVTFEDLSSKQLDELKSSFSKIEGIRNSGSCQKLKCYYFTYDKAIYRTDESAFRAVLLVTRKYVPILKTGTSAQVEKACNNL